MDQQKFAELILYIAQQCKDHRYFGATKLNKVLFESDFRAYLELRKSITGATYFKLDKGPVPKPLVPVREMLIAQGSLSIEIKSVGGKKQERPIALRAPDLSIFSKEELELVDDVIATHKNLTAMQSSQRSHNWIGEIAFWGFHVVGEEQDIPYGTAFLRDPAKTKITKRRQKKAEELVQLQGRIE